jgi:hypothetical protein
VHPVFVRTAEWSLALSRSTKALIGEPFKLVFLLSSLVLLDVRFGSDLEPRGRLSKSAHAADPPHSGSLRRRSGTGADIGRSPGAVEPLNLPQGGHPNIEQWQRDGVVHSPARSGT